MIKSITFSESFVQLREPFITALRRVESYPVIRVEATLESGEVGIGETVATPQISGDSHDQIINELQSNLVKNLKTADSLYELPLLPSTKAAIDLALWEIHRQREEISVATDVTIPLTPIDQPSKLNEFKKTLRDRIAHGFTSFKLKVDQAPHHELLQRIEAIQEVAGEDALIRIDPNQGWSLDYAKEAARLLATTGAQIEYLEQPLNRSDISGHIELAEVSPIPLMADESCFSMRDLETIVDSQAFKYLNVKILKAGGITHARKIAKAAESAGLIVSIGSMMEGEQGIRAAAHLAHEIAPDLIHDLDAGWWITDTSLRYSESILYA